MPPKSNDHPPKGLLRLTRVTVPTNFCGELWLSERRLSRRLERPCCQPTGWRKCRQNLEPRSNNWRGADRTSQPSIDLIFWIMPQNSAKPQCFRKNHPAPTETLGSPRYHPPFPPAEFIGDVQPTASFSEFNRSASQRHPMPTAFYLQHLSGVPFPRWQHTSPRS